MSVDLISGQPPRPALDLDRPGDAVGVCDAPAQQVGEQLPRDAVTGGGSTDTVEQLLSSVARGDQEAFVALQRRTAGLVRANVRRILPDALRFEAVTQELFAEVLEDAVHFDPHRDDAQTWLLTRTHQRAMDELRSVDATDDPPGPSVDRPASVFLP